MNESTVDNAIYHEINGLPSKCKLYSENTRIEGRPLKLIEVKRLSGINEENSDAIINDILRRTIKGINIDNLLVADKLYLIFWLRANTYRESGFSVDYVCSNCKQESSFDFKLENLQIQYLSDEFTLDKFKVTLKNNDTIKYHFLTVSDERKISKFKNTYSTIIKDLDDDLISLSVMIDSINDEPKELIEKYNYLLDLEPSDYCYLISMIDEWNFGLKKYLEVKCDKCGGDALVGITFREDFFLPKYKIR